MLYKKGNKQVGGRIDVRELVENVENKIQLNYMK